MDARALREKLRDYEQVIETMNCGLVAEDLDGNLVFVNRTLLEWLGYEREEVLGQPVDILLPPELRGFPEEDLEAAAQEDLRARLLALRRKDSTTFPVVGIPQRFLDADGKFDGYFYIAVDLGAVLTARQLGPKQAVDLRGTLHRIAMELESISVAAGTAGGVVPLDHADLADISKREAEVLSLLISGDRVPSIAEHLHISQHTVRNHLKSMYRKLGVGTQDELIKHVRGLAVGDNPLAAHERP